MKSMSGFGDFFLDQEYQKIVGLGNKLWEIRDIIDWEKFRPILNDMYRDNFSEGQYQSVVVSASRTIPAARGKHTWRGNPA